MRNFSRPLLLVAALVPFLSASISPAALVHRYSFNSPAGDATDAVLTDSVGSADGVVLGSGALFTGSALDLPGGSSDTAAYGDLPNNLISPLTELTIEGWITIDGGVNNWGRIFDFGSTEPGGPVDGEVTGPGNTNGGGTAGLDYFILTASRGADYDVQRIEVRNEDPAGGGITTIDSGLGTIFGQQFHYAVTWRDTGPGTSEISYWRDGVKLTDSAVVGSNIGDVNDVNNWLGRSTWLNDGNTDATYDEFRIYDTALDDTQISDSRAAGPNAVIAPPGDSDADGIPDEYEDRYPFLNPMDPSDAPLDEDTDGLSNLEEYEEKTKPDVADSDEDGLEDGAEVNDHGTNPLAPDTDLDGLSDGDEITVHSTLPLDPDTDDDGITDGYETLYDFLDPLSPGDAAMDEDLDELANLEEFQLGTAPDDEDSDDDTLTDGAEVNTHNSNPLAVDTDTDALEDGVEVNTTGTLPDNPDTDGDGINDGPEVDAGTDPLLADATKPGVLHRYSFNASPGAAPAMTLIPDLVGGEDGTVIGANGVWTGASLRLPGGDGATADAAYVDLPNGLLSSHDHVTFEAWYTMRSAQNWSRIWDFGSTLGGEVITGMTGATEGQDYFIFAPNRGAEINQQRYTVRNLDPLAPGGGVGPVDGDEEAFDTNEISAIDQEYHIAGVWTSDGAGGAQLILYRDGALLGSRTTSFGPRDINDVNNWLGRSNWTGDSYLDGELNEFRIYDGALNQAAAASSFNAGPDASIGGGDFRITQIIYDPGSDMISLTFTSRNNRTYSLYWDSDLNGLDQELDDSILSDGETTSVGPFPNPSPGAPRVFFRVVEN